MRYDEPRIVCLNPQSVTLQIGCKLQTSALQGHNCQERFTLHSQKPHARLLRLPACGCTAKGKLPVAECGSSLQFFSVATASSPQLTSNTVPTHGRRSTMTVDGHRLLADGGDGQLVQVVAGCKGQPTHSYCAYSVSEGRLLLAGK
jgi:hypothetical protein